MNIMNYKIYIVIIAVFIVSCDNNSDKKIPETPSKVLNEKVQSESFDVINLDNLDKKKINVREKDIIYNINSNNNKIDPLIGQITLFTYSNSKFYIYDAKKNSIYKIDKKGVVEGPLSREGSGPGEHDYIPSLVSNARYIYASDINNARINIYNSDVKPKHQIDDIRSGNLEVSNELLLIDNQRSSGPYPEDEDEGLISINNIDNPTDTLATILPRIIPEGKQPFVYNMPWYSTNNSDEIVASYMPLTWLFLYDDDFNHIQTLVLEYSEFDEMNIPEMDFFEPKGNEGFGGTVPFSKYKLMDNGDIFLSIPSNFEESELEYGGGTIQIASNSTFIHFSNTTGSTYKAVGKYSFSFDSVDETLEIQDFYPSDESTEMYAQTHEYIFRFSLPE